jgi:hypothetical protein
MFHQENVGKLQASLAPKRTPSNLFLNHDEHILQVIISDVANPVVHFTPFWFISFVWKLLTSCCCWLLCWKMGGETVKNVLVLTNQRLIKFKEGSGSENGDYPKRCALSRVFLKCRAAVIRETFLRFFLEIATSSLSLAHLEGDRTSPIPSTDTVCNRCTSPPFSTPKLPIVSRCLVVSLRDSSQFAAFFQ